MIDVGDLVQVPECINGTPSYIGLVVEAVGYKLTIQGGEVHGVKSWDGQPGIDTWDRADLDLISKAR